MTNKLLTTSAIVLVSGIILAFFAMALYTDHARADTSAIPGTVATTSVNGVTTTASLVYGSTTACTARIISTGASPIMIGFTDKQGFVPTGLQGHLQPASTTVAYDSSQYGCNAVRIYSFVAQNITVSQTQ